MVVKNLFNPMQLFLPAIFLLVLGFGNIAVGFFKQDQYEQILIDLKMNSPETNISDISPLRRIQLTRKSEDHNFERLHQAEARRDLYHLVILGGVAMVAVSAILLLISTLIHYREGKPILNKKQSSR